MNIRGTFPVMSEHGVTPVAQLPLRAVLDHEAAAFRNHGQSINRLAARGGLTWRELFALVLPVGIECPAELSTVEQRVRAALGV